MIGELSFAAERRFGSTDYRRWVVGGSLVAAIGYTTATITGFLAFGASPAPQIATALACWIALALATVRPSVAALVVLVSIWGEVNYSIAVATEFPPIGLVVGPVLIAGAGLLMGTRPSLLLAITSVGVAIAAALAAPGAAHYPRGRLAYWLVLYFLCTIGTWAVVALGLASLERVLAAVRAKETELADTICFAPDGILVVGPDDRVIAANPAALALLECGEQQCLGRTLAEVLANDGIAADLPAAIRQADSIEAPIALSLRRPSGERIYAEVTWRRMHGDRRQLSFRDVTERVHAEDIRRRMEDELAHARRLEAIGQLAGGIAHDFNNLLTAVAGSADLLRDTLGHEARAGLLDEIVAAQERGSALTKQLLSFARRDIVQARVFDLSAQIDAMQRLLQRIAGERVQVICDLEAECRVRADVGQIEQALVNIVTNARDAMPDGGPCTVRCRRSTTADGGRWIELSVADHGVGMDEDTRAHAFEPFFTTKPRGRGTGLGLASVHGIVMQSGGRARLESNLPSGTVVTLEFPFADAPVDAVPAAEAVSEPGTSPATILVAEDDDGTLGVVVRILQRAGYRVLLAPDGVAALRTAENLDADLDLLLTDVMMPGLSGPQLARRVAERWPALPVVFMSGYAEDALGEVPGLVLERDFLAKPFSSALLLQRVDDALQRRRREASAPRRAP
ncbi:MAG: response regulator [Gemmatimonadetes bacterium]|nr:response regulator [Gemmatimonadota bacterium]